MQKFKLDQMKNEEALSVLPHISLNSTDTTYFLNMMYRIVSYTGSDESEAFFRHLSEVLSNIHTVDVDSKEDLQRFLNQMDVDLQSLSALFWGYEDGMDLVRLQTLLSNWDAVWFGPSDEAAVLFIPSMDKLFLIHDYGVVQSN